MRAWYYDLVRHINQMDMMDIFVMAIFFVVVGMFFLRGSMFRS